MMLKSLIKPQMFRQIRPHSSPFLFSKRYQTAPVAIGTTGSSDSEHDKNLMISFKCNKCSARTTKFISKHAYNHGTVIIICDECQSKHLIADKLGWFRDTAARSSSTDEFDLEKSISEQGSTFIKGVANILPKKS